MLDDPRLAALHGAFEGRPAKRAPRDAASREAAVALLLRARADLEILLIKRAVRETDPWSGHMALPGGRRSPEDADLLATAWRETHEEIGVRLDRVGTFLGALDEVAPRSPRLPPIVIAPFIASVPPDTAAVADPREVEAALWVPLAALRDEGAVDELVLELEGGRRVFPSFRYGEHVIWGLTHRILEQFLTVAAEAGL